MNRDALKGPDGDGAGHAGEMVTDIVVCLGDMPQNVFGVLDQSPAYRSERDRFGTSRAIKESGSHHLFEGGDLLTDSGLAKAKLVSCSAKRSLMGNSHQCSKVSKGCLTQ
jgi:hypothetical protein